MTTSETLSQPAAIVWAMRRYLLILAAISLIAVSAAFLALSLVSHFDDADQSDYFTQIAQRGDADWYRNFGGRYLPQIQDQDIFYSDVGSSVAAAKRADVVFLGPSFVTYAIDRETLRASTPLDQLNIYNMAFVGIRGGEFSRRVIARWKIRSPLWVINVDDQFVHFFSNDLSVTLGAQKVPIQAIQRSRISGYMTVVGRNLRWRVEDALESLKGGQELPTGLYRNIKNGDMALDMNPAYLAKNNSLMHSSRNQECHTNSEVIDYARKFLNEVGGEVVFTLVPHSQSCVGQAIELAKALNVELVAPPFDGLSTVDGGGHLDKKGAENFTTYLAAHLVQTQAFKRAFADKLPVQNDADGNAERPQRAAGQ